MNLQLPTDGLEQYKSASQRARVGTESWGAANFFCPACESPRLDSAPQGTAAVDYFCPSCESPFQLKSQSKPIGSRIVDAAYSEMKKAILDDRTPNLYVLHYDLARWAVQTVILIPHFAFALSAVERRKPLAATARRAGWVGCNIVLDRIPMQARIPIISNREVTPILDVRNRYRRLRKLGELSVEARGWTLEVLRAIHTLGKKDFTLREDVYSLEPDLARLHPGNRHVRDKIRQQLQILRDMGLVEFLGRGSYRLR